jgi:hypothetical protein
MPRSIDAYHFEPQPCSNTHVKHRQTDRDPAFSLQYLVEVTICGVIVVVVISVKPQFVEQDRVHFFQYLFFFRRAGQSSFSFLVEQDRIQFVEQEQDRVQFFQYLLHLKWPLGARCLAPLAETKFSNVTITMS